MAVGGVDHDQIDAGIDQPLGAGEAVIADAGRRRDAQAPLLVLAGIGMQLRLLDVLDRDQPDAAIVVVDHDQLLDAMLVEEPLGLLHVDTLLDGDELLLGHQLGAPAASGLVAKRTSRLVRMPTSLPSRPPFAAGSTTGMPEI